MKTGGRQHGAASREEAPERAGRRRPSALVLAAGESSRFGGTKQLARLRDGKTLVEKVVDTIPTTQVRETVLVLGHDALAVENALAIKEGVRVVVNPDYEAGLSTSIRVGVMALAGDAVGAMLLLADQPFITRALLRRMLRAFEVEGPRGRIVAASHGDVSFSPPVIFPARYFHELLDLRGDQGARPVIERHARSLYKVVVKSKAVLADIDTPEDLRLHGGYSSIEKPGSRRAITRSPFASRGFLPDTSA